MKRGSLGRALIPLLGLWPGPPIPATAMPAGPDRTTLPLPAAAFDGHIGRTLAESSSIPARPLLPPSGAPNVLIVLLDDAGYGQSGTFGGLIPTPTLDRLAARGLRYTQFNVTAMCSPTRAALLTGRNHHTVGMGTIVNWSLPYPGYAGAIPKSAALLSEVLRENGYATAAIGKWHLIPDQEMTPAGPFDHWPTHQGFDYFYGFLGGETDQWHPELTWGTQPVEMQPPAGRAADYTLNEDLADKAIAWIQAQRSVAPDRPFFLYYATGATHAPLQAPRAWIDRFKGRFDMGWDRYREQVLARQIALGVVPPGTRLTPRPPEIPAWDSLSAERRRIAARQMEVFAGFMAQADHEVGRVIDAIRDVGALDNTLIFYIAGDNGASLEGGPTGAGNLMAEVNGVAEDPHELARHLDEMGGPDSTPFYPAGWGWAGNTPFQWGKRVASDLGGTRDPLVVVWPARIHAAGLRAQYHHVIDIYPTVLEAAGLPAPVRVDGVDQTPVEGISMSYTFDHPDAPGRRTVQYFEMLGNVGIYDHGWFAGRRSGVLPWTYSARAGAPPPWALYDLERDYAQGDDLAGRFPGRLRALQARFDAEAWAHHVYPLAPDMAGRQHDNAAPPGGRGHYTYYAGLNHLYDAMAPRLENRSHTLTARIDIPAAGADGVILAEGGSSAGFVLYLRQSHPVYAYNFFRQQITTLAAPAALPAGPAEIRVLFHCDGGGPGRGATVALQVNGQTVAQARLARTVPAFFSFEETMDVGEDSASAVGNYSAPFPFTGTIQEVDIAFGAPAFATANSAALRRAWLSE